MTKNDFDIVEKELGINLPEEYKRVMFARHEEMATKIVENYAGIGSFFRDYLYTEAKTLVQNNLDQRRPRSSISQAVPGWEKSYVLIGDDTAGAYVAMRLDGTLGLFELGSDVHSQEAKVWPGLNEYVDDKIGQYHQSLRFDIFSERRNPPPGQSSFDPSCPPAERLGIWLNAGPAMNSCQLTYQGDDLNLTRQVLEAGGVKPEEIALQATRLYSSLLGDHSGNIRTGLRALGETPALEVLVGNAPLDHLGRGYWYAYVYMANGMLDVRFNGLIGDSHTDELKIDWEQLCEILSRFIEVATPGGVLVRVKNPIAKRQRDALIFSLDLGIEG